MSTQHLDSPAHGLDEATVAAWNTYNDGSEKPELTVSHPYEVIRWGMAFHEAGHAVVSAAYGARIEVTGVIDLPLKPGQTGWLLTGRTEFAGPPLTPWRFAAQCAAGERAQARHFESVGLDPHSARDLCSHHDDFEYTASRFRENGWTLTGEKEEDDGSQGMSWKTACRIADLVLSALWREVEAVAAGIYEHGLLTGDRAAELAGATNPTPWNGDM